MLNVTGSPERSGRRRRRRRRRRRLLGRLRAVRAPKPCGGGAAGGAVAGEGDGALAAADDAPSSSVSTTCPIVTLSPLLTLISETVPATDDGTSIVALSVSSSMTF